MDAFKIRMSISFFQKVIVELTIVFNLRFVICNADVAFL